MSEQYHLHVNGTRHPVADAWLGESLLYVLRERLGLYGAKGACEQGECGSCSVLVDGELRLLVPRAGGDGMRRADHDRRGPGRAGRADRRAAGLRRRRRRAVRVLHAGARDGRPRPARPEPGADAHRDPRGAVGQHLPLHGLRPPRRGRPAGRGRRGRRGRDAARPDQRIEHRHRPDRRLAGASRRRHQGPGHVRVLVRPPDRRGGVGRDAALASPLRPHRRHRHDEGLGDRRRGHDPHRRRRAREADVRPDLVGPAGLRRGRRALRRRADRRGGRRPPRDVPPRRSMRSRSPTRCSSR